MKTTAEMVVAFDRMVAAPRGPKAVWLPVNDGGWAYVSAGHGTLVCYHVRSVVGGNLPDELATRWSFGTLASLLRGIGKRIDWVRWHYTTGHTPIRHPDGSIIAPFEP